MPLPTGQISMSEVNVELNFPANRQISLNDAAVRSLAAVPSGAISMQNLQGKSNTFVASITTSQQELNLRTWALANGWDGNSSALITVNAGVYIWSNNTAVAGLTINGSWPNGITLVNNGFIMGRGGNGGNSTSAATLSDGLPGGTAISLGVNCTITNNSYIGGGGGGGGGAGTTQTGTEFYAGGGGGAGGGTGGSSNGAAGGAGGSIGANGSNGTINLGGSGGGGGRYFPGTSTTPQVVANSGQTFPSRQPGRGGPGGGGSGAAWAVRFQAFANNYTGVGGVGNGSNTAGGTAQAISGTLNRGLAGGGGGGGGWGASGGLRSTTGQPQGTAASGGKAIALNGFTVTQTGSGTTWGAVS